LCLRCHIGAVTTRPWPPCPNVADTRNTPRARSCRDRPGISGCPIGLCDVGGLIACRLLESSADLHDVRDGLGHANITTTSRYVRSTPVRLAQALERMEASAETVADADDQPHLAAVR
jgi:hypothetical protein